MTHLTLNYRRFFALAALTILLVGVFASIVRFSVLADEAWADIDCKYRTKLTFGNSASSENLTDFPVLVVLNSGRINYSRTNATDIRFYDGSTLLKKETELWNPSGNSYIWVKVPQIDNTNTDYIYAYYGATSTTNLDDAASVWSGYAMVQHLEETSGTLTDSTSNGNNGTPTGVTQDYTGKIDGADYYNGNAYSVINSAASLNFGTNSFSFSVWFNTTKTSATQDILDKKGGTATAVTKGYKMLIASSSSTGLSAVIGDGTNYRRGDTGTVPAWNGTVWAMFTVVVDRTSQLMHLYVNGIEKNSSTTNNVGNVDSTVNLRLGNDTGTTTGRNYQGGLDEVRVWGGARSASWTYADYLSTSDSFITYGNEETQGVFVPLTVTVTNPQNVTYYQTTVPLSGSTNLDANTTYNLDSSGNVSIANNTKTFSTSLTSLSLGSHAVTVYAVESTNASNTNSTTVYFTVAEVPWLSGWNYRRPLTISGSLITGALTDFPVLVKLDSSFFDFNKAKTNGQDIRFTGSDGTTQLKYEIERWNKTAGKAEVWVKLPSVSSGTDTTFYVYYGNPTASDAQDPANVWDSNFMMVQHMEETSGTVTDSTSHGNNGTPYNGTTQGIIGKIDGAVDFDGIDDTIGVPHSTSLNLGTGDFTISVWVMYPATPANLDSDVLRKGNTQDSPPNNYKLELYTNGGLSGNLYDGGNSEVHAAGNYSDDKWHFVVFQRKTGYIYLYVDGNQDGSNTDTGRNVSNTATMGIGSKNSYNDDFFDGSMDEVRISNIARSEAWIEASYRTMNDQLLIYGSEKNAGIKYTLTVSTVGQGSVNLDHAGPYDYLDVVGLEAVPTGGWTFDHWEGDLTGSTNPTTITMTGDKTVTAYFVTTIAEVYIDPSLLQKGQSDIGTTFTADMKIKDIQDLQGFDFKVTWSPSLLTLTSVSYDTALDNIWGSSNWEASIHEIGTGYFKFVAVSMAGNFSGAGPTTLATLTFTVLDPQSNHLSQCSIHFDTHKLSDSLYTAITHTATDGNYQITGATPALQLNPTSKTCRKHGETFTASLVVSSEFDVTGFVFEIHYDTTLLDYSGITYNAWGSGSVTVDEVNGIVSGSTSGGATSGAQTLVTIQFTANYHRIWKDVLGWVNDQSGLIYVQSATLSYSGDPDLNYVRGGSQNKINVGPDFDYTFSPIQGDVDNNGIVDIFDIRTVAFYYDQTNPTYNLTGDNTIDIFDLVVIASNFGYTYTP